MAGSRALPMFQAPSAAGLPPLSILLDSIAAPPARLARHLGISRRTLARYRRADQAPRPIMLALFWESHFGRSWAHAAVFNEARQHAAHARALGDSLHQVRGQLWQVLRAHQGPRSANWPLFDAVYVGAVADLNDGHQDGMILYLRNDAPVAYTPAPQAGQCAGQGLALGAWVGLNQRVQVRPISCCMGLSSRASSRCARGSN